LPRLDIIVVIVFVVGVVVLVFVLVVKPLLVVGVVVDVVRVNRCHDEGVPPAGADAAAVAAGFGGG